MCIGFLAHFLSGYNLIQYHTFHGHYALTPLRALSRSIHHEAAIITQQKEGTDISVILNAFSENARF